MKEILNKLTPPIVLLGNSSILMKRNRYIIKLITTLTSSTNRLLISLDITPKFTRNKKYDLRGSNHDYPEN